MSFKMPVASKKTMTSFDAMSLKVPKVKFGKMNSTRNVNSSMTVPAK